MFTYEIEFVWDGLVKTVTVTAKSFLEAIALARRYVNWEQGWTVADSRIVHADY